MRKSRVGKEPIREGASEARKVETLYTRDRRTRKHENLQLENQIK